MGQENTGITLSPKASFIFGLAGGVLVLCTLGFFILLGLMLGGNGDTIKPAKAQVGDVVAEQPEGQVAAEPEENTVGDVVPVGDGDWVMGPDSAKVTLIEYSDFECPYCGRFHPSIEKVVEDFGDQVRWVYRHFPLSFHSNARPAANAAECAGEQGKFFEFAAELYANQGSLSAEYYDELAAELGLNKTKFASCVDAAKYDDKISADMSGGISAGVQGTPGTIIIGADGEPQLVPGAIPYEQLKALVQQAL